ncbi:A disintegrin and metalloproteinase with thrombospondin motifs like [Microplitis mediator]|uniref:A disintegrin and metalloproteinase with thrombospondin motifs like n=1 Tax=Microplitis mediator TaxID=375433 RepID=UPI0025524810|nr:A disintegrin and metalloproteinase with thrombospondin motifs like [Microplitis mediator]
MTPEERLKIFHTAGTFVPPYEVVTVHSSRVQKRDINAGHMMEMQAYGQRVKAWVTPIDGTLATENTPIYTIDSSPYGPQYSEYTDAMKQMIKYLYENKAQAITVSVEERPDGSRAMNGILGKHNLYIKSLPDRLRDYLRRYGRSVDDFESEHEDKSYHIVYEMPKTADNKTLMTPLTQSIRPKRSAQNSQVLYPEILLLVDYTLYSKIGGNIWDAVPYLLSFWNGVDIMYRTLTEPKYRLNIAAILLAKDPEALEYIQHLQYPNIDVDTTLTFSGYWLYQNREVFPIDSYDIAVTMTSHTLWVKDKKTNTFRDGILGVAWVSGACGVSRYNGNMTKTAVVHDEGAYTGIQTAAHELGHSLGASHDGSDHADCEHNEGNIMAGSSVVNSTKSHEWSLCSRRDLNKFLNEKQSDCLTNRPKKGEAVPRLLPGKLMDANDQCYMYRKAKAVFIEPSICHQLNCFLEGNPLAYSPLGSAAADGTPCGNGLICLHGQCLDENIIM